MTTDLKRTIATKTAEYLSASNLTQSELSNKANVPKEYMSNILKENSDFTVSSSNNKMVVIADKYFTRLADFIGFQLVKSYWKTQATPQLTTIIATLQDAKEFGTTNLIIAETGAGKSHTIDLIQRKFPADTFIVKVGSTDNLSDLIDKIIDVLKITTGKTKSKKLRDVASKLRSLKDDGFKPQLIFDEAEYMKQPALCSMKELHDYLNQYCSIVLVGTDQLTNNLDSLRRKNKPGIPQFYRRIKFGIRKLPTIDRSFKLFLNDESAEVKKFLRTICDNYGELHDVLVPVRREAERTGNEISEQFIRTVLNLPNSTTF
ncbi:MAG: AAA family ATPase [Gelidibacter sp.]